MKPITMLALALCLTSCRCGGSPSSGDSGPVDAAPDVEPPHPGKCCALFHDAGVIPCGDGGANCDPHMPVACSFEGGVGNVGPCP